MKHPLHLLFKTAMRQKFLMLVACLMLGSMSSRASETDVAVAVWDETTATLYFDYYNSLYQRLPAVGSTWTTSQDEPITVSRIWSGDEVLHTGETPGWVTDDIQNACTKVVIGEMGEYTPKSCNKWFYNFSNLTSIEGLYNLVTGDVKSMANMFAGCASLKSIDLIGFDTQNVVDMVRMFSGCTSLTTLYLSTFELSSLRYIDGMFENCTSLKTIYVDASLWITDEVWGGGDMFSGCTSLVGGNGTAYDSNHIGLDYAQVDKKGNPGYLTAGSVFAGWRDDSHILTFGFGDVPRINYLNDEGIFTQVWYGKEALNRSWADAVSEICTTVRFASSFSMNVKGLNMKKWFSNFHKLETVERFDNVTPGSTDYMFYCCYELSSISLPSTIKRIGKYMFGGCTSLSRLFIPRSVTSIGIGAFWGCKSIAEFAASKDNTRFCVEDDVLFTADKKELVAYPVAKTDEKYAVPNGVKTIRDFAFMNSKYLTSVILPGSLSRLGDLAFGSCAALTSVKVYMTTPPSMKGGVFLGSTDRATLYVPLRSYDAYQNAFAWKDFSKIDYFISYYTIWDANAKTLYFDSWDGGKDVPVVGSVWETNMGRKANVNKVWELSGDDMADTQSIPGWSEVKDECEEVIFEDYVKPLSCYGWFANFKKLKGFEYFGRLQTQNVTDMSYMFSGCTKLTELHLGTFDSRRVRSMDEMFSNCTNLKTIYVDESLWNTQQVTTGEKMFDGCTSLVGGNGTAYDSANTGLGYARVDNSDEPGYLTAGIPFIVWCSDNATLSVDFGTAPEVGSSYGEGTVTNVWRDSEVLEIYNDKTPWCKEASSSCMRAVFTDAFAKHIKGHDMFRWFRDFKELMQVQGFENVEVSGTYGMFYRCSNLMSIKLPATLSEIGKNMFFECSSLPSINIPKSVTSMGDWAFAYCSSLSSINLPDNITTIREGTFFNCNALTSIDVPAGVTFINENAFFGCTSLTTFNVDAGNTHYAAVDGLLFTADKKMLVAYPAGKTDTEYTIPVGTQKVGSDAFGYCYNLTSVILPGSITIVDDYSFEECSSLASVKIYAIRPPSIGDNYFNSDIILYVPRGCKEAYEASDWSNWFKNIVEFDLLPGDANGDGEVNAQDIVAIINYIAGESNGNFSEKAADVTKDEQVDIADVIAITNLILSD